MTRKTTVTVDGYVRENGEFVRRQLRIEAVAAVGRERVLQFEARGHERIVAFEALGRERVAAFEATGRERAEAYLPARAYRTA